MIAALVLSLHQPLETFTHKVVLEVALRGIEEDDEVQLDVQALVDKQDQSQERHQVCRPVVDPEYSRD